MYVQPHYQLIAWPFDIVTCLLGYQVILVLRTAERSQPLLQFFEFHYYFPEGLFCLLWSA